MQINLVSAISWSNENGPKNQYKFSAFLALCEGNVAVTGGFISQKKVMRSFDVYFNPSAPEQTVEQTIETPVIYANYDADVIITNHIFFF